MPGPIHPARASVLRLGIRYFAPPSYRRCTPSPCPAYTSAKAASCSGGVSCCGGASSPAGYRHLPTGSPKFSRKSLYTPMSLKTAPFGKMGILHPAASARRRLPPTENAAKGWLCRLKRVCERRSSRPELGTRSVTPLTLVNTWAGVCSR
ncbi:MAG: hypothetical protein MZV64_09670 [Ignavibacteriales bacterium]|nr:hypothetical protein [Ignavibacteriales bacterium]